MLRSGQKFVSPAICPDPKIMPRYFVIEPKKAHPFEDELLKLF